MLGFILYLVVVGFIVGLIARALVPGRDSLGIGGTILLGVAGSFVGGFIMDAIDGNGGRGNDDVGAMAWIGSIVGAVLVLLLWRVATGRRRGLLR